ncbi:hypothetical protein [Terribacillus saccharophilus]|uniref:hypothetical protein n=1 Tax=Terribacillus saccharophilus TaxID=361277 RepID=UPI002DC7CC03|nr:hypothetical protein [Terribacillus saccharophilus]
MLLTSFVFVCLFAVIHFLSAYFDHIPAGIRYRLRSISGGITIAYVFSITLPNLSTTQGTVEKSTSSNLVDMLNSHGFLVAMLGLVMNYGLEMMQSAYREENPRLHVRAAIPVAYYVLFNIITGYLLLHGQIGNAQETIFYFAALGIYLFSSDLQLSQESPRFFRRIGRWLLLVGVLGGWLLGTTFSLGAGTLSSLYAFVSGGIIYHAIKGQMQEQGKLAAFLYFCIPCILYTIIWIMVK